jgi:DNA-binding NarL/FixJ family response regulator
MDASSEPSPGSRCSLMQGATLTPSAKSPAIRVLCVDDHPFIAEGLSARFQTVKDMEYVGREGSADGLVGAVLRSGAQIVLMDVDMPGKDPFEAIDDLRRAVSEARVIMLSAYVRDSYLDAAMDAGAWGYLSKSDDPDMIIESIRKVHRGEFAFGQEVKKRCLVDHMPGRRAQSAKPQSRLQSLTDREREILRMIGRGMSRAKIAETIRRSPKTVDAHSASIMQKMDVHDRVSLARLAIREGLVDA